MARIMFMANAPWCTTGYGVQGKHLVPRLKALGHEIAYFAFYGLDGGVIEYDGVRIYPRAIQLWGTDILPFHMADFEADTLITLIDPWVSETYWQTAVAEFGWRWLPWLPIDSVPISERLKTALNGTHTILPYSRFGEKSLRESGYENVRYIPHGVSDAFTPGDRAAARREHGIPESAFVIGMVAANKDTPSRKCFPEQMTAFAEFHKRHPDSLLYLHTYVKTSYRGVDIPALAAHLGIEDAVMWSDQYAYTLGYPEPRMAELYRAFDVLTACSMSEGFGLPILEAQACGTPVVTTDFTSMTELCWAGELVKRGQRWWTSLNAWHFMPEVAAIGEAYELMFQWLSHAEAAKVLRAQAAEGAKAYHWDAIVRDYWAPLLAQLDWEQRLPKQIKYTAQAEIPEEEQENDR